MLSGSTRSSGDAMASRIASAARPSDAALAQLAEVTFTRRSAISIRRRTSRATSQRYTPAACRETLADPRMAYWLASAEREPPVGFALAGYCKLPVEDLEPTAGELRQLYVLATHQKHGLGTRFRDGARVARGALLAALRRRLVQELRRAALLRPLRFREGRRVRVSGRQDDRSRVHSQALNCAAVDARGVLSRR